MKLVFERTGQGPPLILLHGLFGSRRNLRPAGLQLAEGHEVYFLDLRNHGDSPHDENVGYGAMVTDLVEFLDGQGLASANLLGHSMGGKVAMEFAVRHPRRTRSIIVVDISPAASSPAHLPILDALIASDPSTAAAREEVDKRLEPALPRREIRQFLLTNLVRDGAGYRWRMNLDALRRSYADLLVPVDPGAAYYGPALFLRGGRSDHLPDGDIPLLRRIFPHAEIETIPEAGHWVHADAPEEFVERAGAFLRQSGQ